MTRQTITDLENGRRRYTTTAEPAVIAAALSTAPVALLYPGPYDELVEVLPGEPVRELRAAQRFSGLLTGLDNVAGELDLDYPRNIHRLQRARKIDDIRRRGSGLFNMAAELELNNPGDEESAQKAKELRLQAAELVSELETLEADDGR
jgi:hypothetical protein